jgi:hypothetical protein
MHEGVAMSRRLIVFVTGGVVTVLIGAAVVVAASGGVTPPTATSKASSIATARGPGTVPYDVLDRAGIPRSAVLLEGATTVANLRVLEPGNASRLFRDAAPSDHVYGVVVYQGPNAGTDVSSRRDVYTARLLLDEHGNELLGSSWVTGSKPLPTEPFGPRFDVSSE